MERADVEKKVREVIGAVLEIPGDEIPSIPDLPQELLMDSLIVLEILVEFEDVFGFEIDDDNVLEILDSIGSTTDYITARLATESPRSPVAPMPESLT